jgi:hypothetical protein
VHLQPLSGKPRDEDMVDPDRRVENPGEGGNNNAANDGSQREMTHVNTNDAGGAAPTPGDTQPLTPDAAAAAASATGAAHVAGECACDACFSRS